MAPGFASAASPMSCARTDTRDSACSSVSMSESASAETCPRENPTSAEGSTPRDRSARPTAIDSVAIAAWALRVSFSADGSPCSEHRAATSRPNTSDAHSNTAATSGTSIRSAPMPGRWEPCPEHAKTGPAANRRGSHAGCTA